MLSEATERQAHKIEHGSVVDVDKWIMRLFKFVQRRGDVCEEIAILGHSCVGNGNVDGTYLLKRPSQLIPLRYVAVMEL